MHSVVKTWLAFGLTFFLTGCGQETVQSKPEIHITGSTMGTYYSIKVADSAVQDAARLQAEVDVLLERVNDQMSTYRPDSELSRFNQHKSNTPVVVSRDTARVVTEAIHIGRESRGALDVTVGPLVNLWGFGPDARPTKVPSDELIAQTRQKTGLGNLHVITSADADTLQKDIPDLYVDLSAIAKGFGVDKVAEYLDHPRFTFVEGDISISKEWIEYHVKKCDVVLPLVAIATPKIYVTDPLRVFELDFEENLRIIRQCVKYKKRVIFPSTSEVYGMCDDEAFDETSWLAIHAGMAHWPRHRSPWMDDVPPPMAAHYLTQRHGAIAQLAAGMPPHDAFLRARLGG